MQANELFYLSGVNDGIQVSIGTFGGAWIGHFNKEDSQHMLTIEVVSVGKNQFIIKNSLTKNYFSGNRLPISAGETKPTNGIEIGPKLAEIINKAFYN